MPTEMESLPWFPHVIEDLTAAGQRAITAGVAEHGTDYGIHPLGLIVWESCPEYENESAQSVTFHFNPETDEEERARIIGEAAKDITEQAEQSGPPSHAFIVLSTIVLWHDKREELGPANEIAVQRLADTAGAQDALTVIGISAEGEWYIFTQSFEVESSLDAPATVAWGRHEFISGSYADPKAPNLRHVQALLGGARAARMSSLLTGEEAS